MSTISNIRHLNRLLCFKLSILVFFEIGLISQPQPCTWFSYSFHLYLHNVCYIRSSLFFSVFIPSFSFIFPRLLVFLLFVIFSMLLFQRFSIFLATFTFWFFLWVVFSVWLLLYRSVQCLHSSRTTLNAFV